MGFGIGVMCSRGHRAMPVVKRREPKRPETEMQQLSRLSLVLLSAIALTILPAVSAGSLAPSLVQRRSFLSSKIRWLNGVESRTKSSSLPSLLLSRITTFRGGAFDDYSSSEEEYDDSDDSDFDLDVEDGMFDFDAAEDDFGDESTLGQITEAFHKTPPLTKAYLAASFGAALLGYFTNKNDFPSMLQLEWRPTLTKFQIWRPLTAFLNFGPLGFGYLMTVQFIWTYMSTLERLNHNAPYDFWLMILFGAASMLAGYSAMGLSPRFLGHNLSTFLVYVWSRYHEGLDVNMFELFNTRAELLPWFFLAQVSAYSSGVMRRKVLAV